MLMRKMMILLVLLTGCGTNVDFASPSSVSITRHITSNPKEVADMATGHCLHYGKDVELVSRSTDSTGYYEAMTFRCVPK